MKNGRRLKELIEACGITQKEFATKIGIAPSTLNGYITSTREPDLELLVLIAKNLSISIDSLMNFCSENDETLILSPTEISFVKKIRKLNLEQQDALIEYLDFLISKKL